MKLLPLLLLLVGCSACNNTLSPQPLYTPPLCVWHFDVPGLTGDSEQSPTANCIYLINGNDISLSADLPGRFSIAFGGNAGIRLPVSSGKLQLTGGCPEWDPRRSFVDLENNANESIILNIDAACNGYSLQGFVMRQL